MIRGIKEDAEHLSSLGLKGTVSNSPDASKMASWETNYRFSQRALESFQ